MESELKAQGPVDINEASVEELRDRVSGIGQVLAERIVAYRDQYGPFSSLEDLTQVSGIGPELLKRLAPQLTVAGAESSFEDK
ncbi:MAG: helix-hairpin-helix domain-containing protein, partial [Anaerolineae bacterium]|nr:helix-hairpin-helix domain-containing protein [Anaerolineae bacterium]